MKSYSKTSEIKTSKKQEMLDITKQVNNVLKDSKIKEGILTVYSPHTTSAVIINENYDPNVCLDILECLSKLIPEGKWRHNKVDNNASAHIKSSIMGSSRTIPIENNKLQLGQWQSVMFVELDGPRDRKVIVKIIGE